MFICFMNHNESLLHLQGGGGGGRGKSVPIRWVLYHRRVLYLRVVALQMEYCAYLFEDSVTKI